MVNPNLLPQIEIPTLEVPQPISGSGGHRFIDGDTLINEDGNLLRIQGLNAPEINHLMSSGYLKPGTPGGLTAAQQIERLAEKFGYNNVHYLTNPDGSKMLDPHGRQVVRLTDNNGRDFTETLTRYGVNKLGRYSSQEEVDKYRLGIAKRSNRNIFNPLNDYEKAALTINDAIKSEQWYDTEFAKAALNETELARLNADRQPGEDLATYAWRKAQAAKYSNVHVQQRHTDRTLDNKALHPWSESFDIGWTGVIESLYGAAELVGAKTGFNWLEELGEAGIKRQREYLAAKPDLKLSILKPVLDPEGKAIDNEWDVEGFGDFFRYIGNMTAVSLPYMGVTAAGWLTAPIGGMAAPASMYTGMTWNDMEGESKDKSATLAVAGGLTMTVLDRLGIKLLMGKMTGNLLSPKFREQAVAKLKEVNPDWTDAMARTALASHTRMAAAELIGDAAKVAKEQLKYGNIIRAFAARAGQGFLIESSTEIGQELAQYLASTAGSDKPFDSVELHNRLVNAFVAGGTLGSAFSVPGTAYDVGAWTDVHVRQLPAQEDKLSKEGKYQEEEEYHLHDRYKEGDEIPPTYKVGDIKPNGRYKFGRPTNIEEHFDQARKEAILRQQAESQEIQTLEGQLADPEVSQTVKRNTEARLRELRNKTNLTEKEEAGRKNYKDMSVWEKLKAMAKEFPVLWRGATRHYFAPLSDGNPELRKLAGGYGAYLHQVHPGQTFENFKHNKLTDFKNKLGTVTLLDSDGNAVQEGFSAAAVAKALGKKNINQLELSKIIYAFYMAIGSTPINEVDWASLPAEIQAKRVFLESLAKRFNDMEVPMFDESRDARTKFADGTSTGRQFTARRMTNYLGQYRSIDKVKIEKNRAQFIKDLQADRTHQLGGRTIKPPKYTYAQAVKLADAILDNNDIVDENSLFDFSVGKGIHIPSQLRKRTLNMATDPLLKKYMEQDLFINLSNAAKSAARYITYQKYIGDNGEIINEFLERSINKGEISRDTANSTAAFMQDYLNGESGNYKKIKDPRIANLQKNILVWTTLAGLPMATISSLVEYMMLFRALSPEQINDVLKTSAKEFGGAIYKTMTTATPNLKLATSTEGQLDKERRQERLKRLGYFTWDTGAAQTTGATENTFASRYMLDKYFRIILLQQWTDMTRNIRGAIADDFIMHHLGVIREQRTQGKLFTNAVQESEQHLRNLGINIEELLEIDDLPFDKPADMTREEYLLEMRRGNTRLNEIFSNAEFNFINEAVALPGTANRPLFYQNPHLALFTQFQGFIATFTANHIPRMWGDYVKRGTPAMKYNAFAIMTLMIAMGFAAQYLKDLIKYGQGSPYLDSMEKLQRGLGASGMLGVAERPLNFFFPIYETSSSNMIEELFQTVSGEAAALSNVTRAVTGATQVVEGAITEDSIQPGLYKLFKTTPGVGPFNQFNRWTSQKIADVFES